MLSEQQVAGFHEDGFLIVEEGFLADAAVEALRERFGALFAGEYGTGIAPDEVNWKEGRDPEDRTRQICNGWRADDTVAAQVLSEQTGRLAAQLMGYRGTRMLQDNCLWKPPGAKSLGMHQDGSFADYLVPAEMITCWVALDDTRAQGGTIEYVRGSHRWPKAPPSRGEFHAPENWLAPAVEASPDGELDRVPVVVKAGGCTFHHSLTFHGSGPNEAETHRRALVSHLIPVETRFHPDNVDLVYSRYRRRGDLSLDESFFPVLWDETGARSTWLSELPSLP
jgi:ectoine hydroxylase-related dioxygenase (phytanoyl-CoA dioxygenase family)